MNDRDVFRVWVAVCVAPFAITGIFLAVGASDSLVLVVATIAACACIIGQAWWVGVRRPR
jgi:hypothetical protein